MSTNHTGNSQPAISQEEHEASIMPPTKRVLNYGYDGSAKNLLFADTNGIQRSIVTIASNVVTSIGNVTLNSSPNQIGSVTISNLVSAINFIGNTTVSTTNPIPVAPPLAGYLNIGIDQTDAHNVVNAGGSTVYIGSTPTIFAVVNTTSTGQASIILDTGTKWIGLVSTASINGTVAVTSIIPGTGATNLGKAVDDIAGATDTGVALLGIRTSSDAHDDSTTSDGDYARFSITDFKELRTKDQRSIDLCNCNNSTAVVALSNDTTNISNATNHVFGSGALKFDKVNGADNTVYGGVWASIATTNISEIFEAGGFVGLGAYLPSLTNVVNIFLRVGTDVNNYNTWTWPVSDLTASTWLNLRKAAASPDYARGAGTGWNTGGISYVAFGTEFSGETNTLAGMHFDHVHIVGGRVTSSDINAAISSTVNTPNINLQRVGGTATDTGSGNVTAGTLRVTVAADSTGQIKLAAGISQVGSVTVSNPITFGSNVTLNASNAYIGLTSVNIGGTLPALSTGTAQIGSVTIANQQPLIAGTAWIGFATTNQVNQPALTTGSAWIGLATTVLANNPTVTIMSAPYSYYNQSSLISGYVYHGFTAPGNAANTATFRLMRESLNFGDVLFASGVATFIHTWSAASTASITYL